MDEKVSNVCEKFSKETDTLRKTNKQNLGNEKPINQIRRTVESITNRLYLQKKEYQGLKVKLRKYYIQTEIKKKINKHVHNSKKL
jgi:hypothetical protein